MTVGGSLRARRRDRPLCVCELQTVRRKGSISIATTLALLAISVTVTQGFGGMTSVRLMNHASSLNIRPRLRSNEHDLISISLEKVKAKHCLSNSCLMISKEDVATGSFGPINYSNEDRAQMAVKAASVAIIILLLSSTIVRSYPTLLLQHPLPTKALTSGALCGISDIIAQLGCAQRKEFNFDRFIRFAGKGCVGGLIWSFWYDNLDRLLDFDNDLNFNGGILSYIWVRDHTAIVTTALSIFIEQFFWCPIVFGAFEIPVSTLLNGGSLSTVKKEVDSKLNELLLSNAKVWTFANVVIYNAPVEWRPLVSNCVDLFWQSIVSNVAADCGNAEEGVCDVMKAGKLRS